MGSLPNQSTCALWIWRGIRCVPRGILWGVLHERVRGPLLGLFGSLYDRAGAWFALPADLQHVLGAFAVCSECEAAGMRISTSKSEAMVLSNPEKVVCLSEGAEKGESSRDRSIYVPTLTYGHELWVMTERTRSGYKRTENEFPPQGGWAPLRDRVRSFGHSGGAFESRCSFASRGVS
ncbi:hypothetical protein L3Q82_024216 [Scortum barcoo]|uniref:Uncharacterized protein n=1 Tax=Scortum barcoo TaxID=214431 RepID=A0ACB8WV14_9TELE|nr:hypothetical protein L3Q82_024216 [Scortum barcoo]